MANVLATIPAEGQRPLYFWLSTCPGFEYITKQELQAKTSAETADYQDLLEALPLDTKRWQYGQNLLRGKFAFMVKSADDSADGCANALQTISSLKSVEYASTLISFVVGRPEGGETVGDGIKANPLSFQANTRAFIESLERLDEDGPAGSVAAWQRGLSVWQQWQASVDGVEGGGCADIKRPRFRVTAQRGGPKSFHDFTEREMAQALAKGIESQLGWEADTTDYDLEVDIRLRYNSLLVSIKLNRTRLSLSNGLLRHRRERSVTTLRSHLAYSLCACVGLREAPPATVVCDPMCGGGTTAEVIAMAFPQCFVLAADVNDVAITKAGSNIRMLSAGRDGAGAAAADVAGGEHGWRQRSDIKVDLVRWDARRIPLRDGVLDKVCTDLPYGKRIRQTGHAEGQGHTDNSPQDSGAAEGGGEGGDDMSLPGLYPVVMGEVHRVLRKEGEGEVVETANEGGSGSSSSSSSSTSTSSTSGTTSTTSTTASATTASTTVNRLTVLQREQRQRRHESGQCVLLSNMKKLVLTELAKAGRQWRRYKCHSVNHGGTEVHVFLLGKRYNQGSWAPGTDSRGRAGGLGAGPPKGGSKDLRGLKKRPSIIAPPSRRSLARSIGIGDRAGKEAQTVRIRTPRTRAVHLPGVPTASRFPSRESYMQQCRGRERTAWLVLLFGILPLARGLLARTSTGS
jgi:hypothetical protein